MRIAFYGKGGSGKTTISSAFIKYLAEHKKQPVLAVDADLNVNLGEYLEFWPIKNIGSHVEDIAKLLEPKANYPIIGTTPPTSKTNFQRIKPENIVVQNFGLSKDNLMFLQVGSYADSDIGANCYHGKLKALEIILHRTLDTAGDWIVSDSTAGVDSLGTSLFFSHDLVIFVIEPSLKSVNVYKTFLEKTAEFKVPSYFLINKYEPDLDAFFEQHLEMSQCLGKIPVSENIQIYERGTACGHDDFVLENLIVWENVATVAGSRKKDWAQYYYNLLHFHQKMSASWYDSYYNLKLMDYVEKDFNFENSLAYGPN